MYGLGDNRKQMGRHLPLQKNVSYKRRRPEEQEMDTTSQESSWKSDTRFGGRRTPGRGIRKTFPTKIKKKVSIKKSDYESRVLFSILCEFFGPIKHSSWFIFGLPEIHVEKPQKNHILKMSSSISNFQFRPNEGNFLTDFCITLNSKKLKYLKLNFNSKRCFTSRNGTDPAV